MKQTYRIIHTLIFYTQYVASLLSSFKLASSFFLGGAESYIRCYRGAAIGTSRSWTSDLPSARKASSYRSAAHRQDTSLECVVVCRCSTDSLRLTNKQRGLQMVSWSHSVSQRTGWVFLFLVLSAALLATVGTPRTERAFRFRAHITSGFRAPGGGTKILFLKKNKWYQDSFF